MKLLTSVPLALFPVKFNLFQFPNMFPLSLVLLFFLQVLKLFSSWIDHCVYFQKLQEGTFIYLLLYVDDMLIASKSKVEIERLKTQLNLEFEMKDRSL